MFSQVPVWWLKEIGISLFTSCNQDSAKREQQLLSRLCSQVYLNSGQAFWIPSIGLLLNMPSITFGRRQIHGTANRFMQDDTGLITRKQVLIRRSRSWRSAQARGLRAGQTKTNTMKGMTRLLHSWIWIFLEWSCQTWTLRSEWHPLNEHKKEISDWS